MQSVQSGNIQQMDTLYRRYKQVVFGYLYGIHRDYDLAQDLLQTVFFRVMKYSHTFQLDSNFRHWLFRIAKNVSKDHFLKNRQASMDAIGDWSEKLVAQQQTERELLQRESKQLLQQALKHLDHPQREVLVLSKLKGMKYADIADILQCSEGAVKLKVFRALKALRKVYVTLENR